MERKAAQLIELEARIKQLREAAAKRDKPEQEGDKCQSVATTSPGRG